MHLRANQRGHRGLIRRAPLQVKVPQSGVRVLIASDGVWDAFEKMLRVCRMARAWHIEVRGPWMQNGLPQILWWDYARSMTQLMQWPGPQRRLSCCFRMVLHE